VAARRAAAAGKDWNKPKPAQGKQEPVAALKVAPSRQAQWAQRPLRLCFVIGPALVGRAVGRANG
jgi:hypothetical protein